MIDFIKNDKYVSYINFIVILVFVIFKITYEWFLVVELTIISLYLIFMLFRYYLISKIKHNEYNKIKNLFKMKFEYKDYSSIYENIDDFELEVIEYKKLINVVLINFLRMDRRLNIESYKYLELGLDNLKEKSSDNKEIKNNYKLVCDSIDIVKKYYDNDCYRKDSIKNYNKLLILLVFLTLLAILPLILFLINKNIGLFSIISCVLILILFIIILLIKNKHH